MKYLLSAGVAFSFAFATAPVVAAVEWCAVQTNNGKIVKCHTTQTVAKDMLRAGLIGHVLLGRNSRFKSAND
tara:strand:- start:774 stop:989 length:216 start_codon:yes stop_codon:yes gene_type:complete